MKVFYKCQDKFFYGDVQNFEPPKVTGEVHIGIDGSTSSFGFAWVEVDTDAKHVMMFIREEETHSLFFSALFPLIQSILYESEVVTATYEKTPTDFESKSHAMTVMKNTEKAVGNFLNCGSYLDIKHKFNVFAIFPNSWKAFLVVSDPDNNYRKTEKRINAKDILNTLGMNSDFWLKEADDLSDHSYDAFEALAICSFGSKFIYRGMFTAVYRNFKKRRPLQLLYKGSTWETFSADCSELKVLLGSPSIALMVPNEHHSFMENLYALDSSDHSDILVVQPDDNNELYLYFKFLTGIEGMIILTVSRLEIETKLYSTIYI